MNTNIENCRKRGPVAGPPTAAYTVMLEPETADWAKSQPGGLSQLVRECLRASYENTLKKPINP